MNCDIKGVNLYSSMERNPAPLKAFSQVLLEKKWVKPMLKAKKLGKSRKCSIIINAPSVLHTLRHSVRNSTLSSLDRIS